MLKRSDAVVREWCLGGGSFRSSKHQAADPKELQELIDEMEESSLREYLEAYLSITLVGAERFACKKTTNHVWCPKNKRTR